jgi:hypothetical protein
MHLQVTSDRRVASDDSFSEERNGVADGLLVQWCELRQGERGSDVSRGMAPHPVCESEQAGACENCVFVVRTHTSLALNRVAQ